MPVLLALRARSTAAAREEADPAGADPCRKVGTAGANGPAALRGVDLARARTEAARMDPAVADQVMREEAEATGARRDEWR